MSGAPLDDSNFSKTLFEKLTYNTKMSSSKIGFENLKKLHPSLNENDIFALAYMALNPAISEEERNIFKECLKLKCQETIYL